MLPPRGDCACCPPFVTNKTLSNAVVICKCGMGHRAVYLSTVFNEPIYRKNFFLCIGLYKIIRGRCAINEVPLMNRTRDTWKWGIASVKVCPTVVIRRLKRQSA